MIPPHYHIAELLTKYFHDELHEEEAEILKRWIAESEENKNFFNQLKSDNTIQEGVDFLSHLDYNEGWKSVNKKRKYQHIQKLLPYISAAAVLFICIGVALYFYKSDAEQQNAIQIKSATALTEFSANAVVPQLRLSDGRMINLDQQVLDIAEANGTNISGTSGELLYHPATQNKDLFFNTIAIPKKGFFKVTLSDGTKVWLNSHSRLEYPVSFDQQKRQVKLSGEAYFEVKRDATRPFSVEVSGKSIQVLGTKFNVNASQSIVKTTLLEGSIKVVINDKTKILVPGQEAAFSNDVITIKRSDTEKVMAWKRGEFFFRKETINGIMDEVSRWYDIDVLYQEDDFEKKFSGSISRSLPLPKVLEMLHFLSGYKFVLTGKTVTVYQQSTK